MMLNEDFKDLLADFSDARVEFLLVGGYAMAAHGFPRATGDIDLWVRPTAENAERVFQALARFGAPLTGITPQDFTVPETVFQMGVSPCRIDLLTSISGVGYEEARRSAVTANLDGIAVMVLSLSDLIRNKSATGRPRDLIDAKKLEGCLKRKT